MNSREVTIIVPIYNGSPYLLETLNSLLSQTFLDFELLAIDDGSTDTSGDIVRALKDERVRLIQTKNRGLCQALNLGIAEARSPYIARCDQDDLSSPERLARQLRLMKDNPEAVALFTYSTKFGRRHHWSNADKLRTAAGEVIEYDPAKDGCILGSTMFARTSILRSIGGFRQSYYPADDLDLECRLSQAGSVLILREPLVAYRFQSDANTYKVFADMRDKSRWAKDSYHRRLQGLPELTIEQFRLSQPRDLWSRMGRRSRDSSKMHMRIAGQRFLDGRYLAASGHLARAVLADPSNITARIKRYFSRS
ncbi:MAG: glycosyltransferase family 2 protein [Terracidiphilus sp.]